MQYAIFQTGGKQYKAQIGSILEIEKIDGEAENAVKFEDVLFLADNGKFHVGTPHLSGAFISGKILEQKKGKKIRVAKFKAKSRYRKVQGHRQSLIKIEITKITSVKGDGSDPVSKGKK